jgi:mannan endo-1,4-beta-mannosidase
MNDDDITDAYDALDHDESRVHSVQPGGATRVPANILPPGRHRQSPMQDVESSGRRHWPWIVVAIAVAGGVVAGIFTLGVPVAGPAGRVLDPSRSGGIPSSASSKFYIGVYQPGVPGSYAGLTSFAKTTGVHPNIALYYSGWLESFQVRFADSAARHGAMPLIQVDPTGVSLASIAAGHYDSYLRSYADSVRSFGRKVILGFGHEVNGYWYGWGYTHTPANVFVAAWRHIVDVFRQQGADNVIWMWTVNIIHPGSRAIANPSRWWPGSSYVNWIGIDGYYYRPSWTFAPLFGPTIKIVHSLSGTPIPILVSETGAPAGDQPAKIANLFAGIRAYGLLGFVWFDANGSKDWALSSPAAIAAFRKGADAVNDPPP